LPENRLALETKLKDAIDVANGHRERANESRQGYYGRRGKAVEPMYVQRGYLSLAIDGAGAQVTNYTPRYSTSEKGEPARHDMLKIKSTYVKVSMCFSPVITCIVKRIDTINRFMA
jgi:hypothetical protein